MRIALYSHDTMGLGHLRRNLRLAHALADSPLRATVLLITGAREASAFRMPHGSECIALPGFFKDISGGYRSRSLELSLGRLVELRSAAIESAIESFSPHAMIVDKLPRGALRELDPTLEMLRKRGETRMILGLRDVLDDPARVDFEWTRDRNSEAVRSFYDAVWIYGDRKLYDATEEYPALGALRDQVSFTGYLAEPPAPVKPERLPLEAGRRLALCLVGGGQDGDELASCFAQARLPDDTSGVIVTGPFMSESRRTALSELALQRGDLHVLDFVSDADSLIARADHVVTMGGYNTVCEGLRAGKRMLIVPRTRPRTEQQIRADRLSERNLADVVYPDQLDPKVIETWLRTDRPPINATATLDFNGLSRVPGLLASLMPITPSTCFSAPSAVALR